MLLNQTYHLIAYDHTPDTPKRKPVVIKTVETRDGEVNIQNISWYQENVFHTFHVHLDIHYTVKFHEKAFAGSGGIWLRSVSLLLFLQVVKESKKEKERSERDGNHDSNDRDHGRDDHDD